jgi:hypothetical protein
LFPNLRILSDLQITAIFCIQISFPTQFVRNAGLPLGWGYVPKTRRLAAKSYAREPRRPIVGRTWHFDKPPPV